jgi:DNA invertase Pin-like site-specific DNA recombinase
MTEIISEEKIMKIRQYREAGMRAKDIAADLGVSQWAVWKYSKDMLVPEDLQHNGISRAKKQKIQRLFRKNIPKAEIARRVGVCAATVYKYTKKQPHIPKPQRTLPKDTIRVMKKYDSQGMKYADIADALGITVFTVRRYCGKRNKPEARKKRAMMIAEYRKAGMPLAEIAKKCNCSDAVVYRALKDAGLTGNTEYVSRKKRKKKGLSCKKGNGRKCRTCGKPLTYNWFYCRTCHHRMCAGYHPETNAAGQVAASHYSQWGA